MWLGAQNVKKGLTELLTLSPLSPSPVDWISPEKLEASDLSSILPLATEFVEP